jgi:hypothetical protein
MSQHIDETDVKRWLCIKKQNNTVLVFGNCPMGSGLVSGQPYLQTFLTEDELEIYVDNILGTGYYQIAVETSSELFMGFSGKYEPTPEPEPPIEEQ